jgi:sialate O-acetylesterase
MLTINPIFSDNMILQRHKPIRIWGTSDADVTVTLGDNTVTVTPQDGRWMAELPSMDAAIDVRFIVHCDGQEIVVNHAAVGELWIAGGQSNMEFALRFDAEREQIIPTAKDVDFRFFDIPKTSYLGQENDDDYSAYGFWRSFTPQNAPFFSAVATYFGIQLREKLHVPIGIIGCNWGGTSASSWLPSEELINDTALNVYIDEYEKILASIDIDKYDETFKNERRALTDPRVQSLMDGVMRGDFTNEQMLQYLGNTNINLLSPGGPKHQSRPGALY